MRLGYPKLPIFVFFGGLELSSLVLTLNLVASLSDFLVKKDGMPEVARKIVEEFMAAGINAKFDQQHSIGKRYARPDEVGTPFCLTVDGQTAGDDTVTIRYRDDRRQERIKVAEAVQVVQEALKA